MSTQSFIASVLPDARVASARTGVPVAVILAQWAIETGWGTSPAWLQGHNYAGVSYGGSVNSFPDRATGLAAYITVMGQNDYTAVRTAGSDTAAALALGESPWAGGHYVDNSGAAGGLLLKVINENGLAAYDTGQSGSPPATNLSSPIDPITGAVGSVAGTVAGAVEPIVIKGLLLAGGVALIVLAGWKATTGVRAQTHDLAGKAADVAAVAA